VILDGTGCREVAVRKGRCKCIRDEREARRLGVGIGIENEWMDELGRGTLFPDMERGSIQASSLIRILVPPTHTHQPINPIHQRARDFDKLNCVNPTG
jgi:hypothetical protein